jgi:hypothetical protein
MLIISNNIVQAPRPNLVFEKAPSDRSVCKICMGRIYKGGPRIHYRLSNYHADCFVTMVVSVPEIRELVSESIQKLTIERMTG